jgi:hypothetical protein
MPLRAIRHSVLAVLLACSLAPLGGCNREDGPKLAVVQALAHDLGSARLLRARAGCQYLVANQRDLFLCDGMVQTLIHFAPGFPGSTVTIAGHRGGVFNRPARLIVHYEGRDGRGNLEVLLQREQRDWRIAAIIPSN